MTQLFALKNIAVVFILALGGMIMSEGFKLSPKPYWPFIVSGLWGAMVYFLVSIINNF